MCEGVHGRRFGTQVVGTSSPIDIGGQRGEGGPCVCGSVSVAEGRQRCPVCGRQEVSEDPLGEEGGFGILTELMQLLGGPSFLATCWHGKSRT